MRGTDAAVPITNALIAKLDEAKAERSRDMPVEKVRAEARAEGRDPETLVMRMRELMRMRERVRALRAKKEGRD